MNKVMIISTGLAHGGLERVSSILANELSNRGYKVYFLALYHKEKTYILNDKIVYFNCDINENSKVKRYYLRSKFIFEMVKKYKPDIIYSFVSAETLILTITGSNNKVVYSERTDPTSDSKKIKIIKKFLYSKSKCVVFQTVAAREYFSDKIKKKSVVIANPIDQSLPSWEIDNHEKIVLTACRISPEKNIEMLLNAFKIFVEKNSEYKLKIYGEITNREYYKKLVDMVKNNDIKNEVSFCGFCEDVQEQEKNGEIFVLTSNYEGLSNSMLEALCMGMPCICTDCPCGGAATYIKDGVNGFLVAVNDYKELAIKMDELVGNLELEKRFSEEAKKLKNELDKSYIVDQWEELID